MKFIDYTNPELHIVRKWSKAIKVIKVTMNVNFLTVMKFMEQTLYKQRTAYRTA